MSKTPIKTVDPEHEPEYVEARPEPVSDECSNWVGDYVEDIDRCGDPATHTIVMRTPTGRLATLAMCDACGEPDDVDPDPAYGHGGYGQHIPETMTHDLSDISLWDDDTDSPTYYVGGGTLDVQDDHIRIRFAKANARRVDLPDDTEGWSILASTPERTLYEGTITARRRVVSGRGVRIDLRCDPDSLTE